MGRNYLDYNLKDLILYYVILIDRLIIINTVTFRICYFYYVFILGIPFLGIPIIKTR